MGRSVLRPYGETLGLGFVLVEPAGYIQHFGDVMAGTAADSVRLFRNAHENGLDVEQFQSGVKLLGFGDGSAVVGFASHDEGGRFDFDNLVGERALHVLLGIIPGVSREQIFCGERNIAGEHEAVPVDYRIERGGCTEAIGVLDGPGGEDAATTAAGNEEIVGVDVAFGDDGVDAAIEIVEIVARIGVVDEVGEFFAVAGAAAGVGVEHDVTHGGPDLFFEIEAVAVVAEGSTVNFEDERIFFGGIEGGRLNDPALDLALVFGRFVRNFFDVAGNFLLQQFRVDRGQNSHRAADGDGDVAGIVGPAIGEGDGAGARDREGAATVGAGAGDDVVGDFLEVAIGGGKADFGVALIVVEEIDAGIVRRPFRRLDVAVEFVGDGMGGAAVAVHQIELGGLVALVAVVESGVGDEFTAGRNSGSVVRAFAIGERAQSAVGNAEFVDFGVENFMVGFGVTVGGDEQEFAVRRPGGARGAEFVAAVREISVGDLARGAAFGGDYKHLHKAGLEIAGAVEAIHETVVCGGGLRPFCAGRSSRKIGDVRAFAENEGGEGKHFAVRGPSDGVWRFLKIGDARGLPGIHPANVDLLLAVGVGEIGDAGAVGRPARRDVGAIAGGERAVIRAVGVDAPEIGVALVGHGIGEAPNVDNFLAVG